MLLICSILIIVITGFYFYLKPKPVLPFPSSWEKPLEENVNYYRKLSDDKRIEFKRRMMIFLSEIEIEAIDMPLQEKSKMLIAASAVIPVFGFKDWYYANLTTVILYPKYFDENFNYFSNKSRFRIAGMVGSGPMENHMILSQEALFLGFDNNTDKDNTAIHEFVHLIDKEDGVIDGLPKILMQHQYAIPWLNIIHEKMEAINNNQSDIRSYGGTNKSEFFAVASEYFFERPQLLKKKHPELYNMLVICFQQKI